jgi:hypothetical protein
MSDQQTPGGVFHQVTDQALAAYDSMLDTMYGPGTAARQREAREAAVTAAAEADARTAELTAKHLQRSDFRERLTTIQHAATTAGLVAAILLALAMAVAVNLIIWSYVP